MNIHTTRGDAEEAGSAALPKYEIMELSNYGNLVCAKFRHYVSRTSELHLCAHTTIINQDTEKLPRRIAKKAAVSGVNGYSDRENMNEKRSK